MCEKITSFEAYPRIIPLEQSEVNWDAVCLWLAGSGTKRGAHASVLCHSW